MKRVFIAIITLAMLFNTTSFTHALTREDSYVRTANYFLMSGSTLDSPTTVRELAEFDLIVIPVEAQVYNCSFFSQIRALNNDIIILPYIPTVSWNDVYWVDSLHKSLYTQIKNDWWLTDGSGHQVSVWPDTRALNLNGSWGDFLPTWVQNEILSTGYWDGIFYDEVQDSISWVGKTDVDDDGKDDTAFQADSLWAEAYKQLFETTRELVGEDRIIITNGSSNTDFTPYVNGRMFETFPSSDNTLTEWKTMTLNYLNLEDSVGYPSVQVINVNTENTGDSTDYQKVRFGLTTTLLGNGYFAFDYGTKNHAQLWSYDEYDVYLGAPKSSLQNTLNPQGTSIDTGVWERDFENGKVLVNATTSTQTIRLDGEYEKIHGTQDLTINNGSIVYDVTIGAQDGVILLRPIAELLDSTYLNGAFARVFNMDGDNVRTGFFAYDSAFRGGNQIIVTNIDSDKEREVVVADETYVYIYDDDGSLHAKFAPYTETYTKGINVSIGDIENDGSVEIVTGTENGGGPHIRVFNADGVLINPGFFAYANSFRGGVNVAIGDLNGDGIKEIITGAGYSGGPHIRVFKKDGTLINPGFFAYDPTFRGGVNISVGDVNGDGIDEIVTGPGVGGNSLVRVFDRDGNLFSEFEVLQTNSAAGLEIVVSDVDQDGVAEIIGLTTDVFTLSRF